jgi:hypothetical protein
MPKDAMANRKAMLVLAVLGALGTVAALLAISIPKFLHNRNRSKPAEAKYTLRTLLTSEEAFRSQQGYWATRPRELVEFTNSAPRNYTCFLGPSGAWGGNGEVKFEQLPEGAQARLTQNEVSVAAQKAGDATAKLEADFTIVCAGNFDEDPLLDVWSLSAHEPTPRHDQDDFAVP